MRARGEVNDNCGIGIDAGRAEDGADRSIVPQLVALLRRFEDRQGSDRWSPRAARILNCPVGLWTIVQHAAAQLPGTSRHRLSNKDGSQV